MTNKLAILADENIPGLQQLCSDWAEISLMPGREISAKHLTNIDILFVGSKTARREAIFHKLKESYPTKKIEFVFDWSLSAPAHLTKKLKQAK